MKTPLGTLVLQGRELALRTIGWIPGLAPDEAVRIAAKIRAGTIAAIEARAQVEGATLKQVVSRALSDAGIEMAHADLEDGTLRRKAA